MRLQFMVGSEFSFTAATVVAERTEHTMREGRRSECRMEFGGCIPRIHMDDDLKPT